MVDQFMGFRHQRGTVLTWVHVGDVRARGDGDLLVTVETCRDGEVGEREDGTALAGSNSIEVSRRDEHFRLGVSVGGFREVRTDEFGEGVVFKEILNGHLIRSEG